MTKKDEASLYSSGELKLLSRLRYGVELIFTNAEALFQESDILTGHGVLARAYLLHQISMEECGKIELIVANAMQLIMTYRASITSSGLASITMSGVCA